MTYIWPIANALQNVTQEYGANRNNAQPGGHTGMDFAGSEATPILAEADGVIVFEGFAEQLGWPNVYYIATNAILPRAGGSIMCGLDVGPFQFWHGHLSRTVVNTGDHVKQGQVIGYMGNTGYSFGTHLHLDVLPDRWNVHSPDGRYGRVNPRNVIDGVPNKPPAPAPLKPNERYIGGSPVNLRADPWVAADNIVEVYPAGRRDFFTHWARGEMVNWNGAKDDRWLYDGKGWLSVLFVDPGTTDGLKEVDVSDQLPWNQAKPAPAPAPAPAEPTLRGIDISGHQAGINLGLIPWDFVLIKATEGVGYRSPQLVEQAAGAPAGKRRGFYHFSRFNAQDGNTAAAEAAWFIEVVRQVARPGDVMVLDLESDDHNPDLALKFLRTVQGAFGGLPLLYINSTAVNAHDWSVVEQEFPLWLAAYPAGVNNEGYNPPAKHPTTWAKGFKMWQYTSEGRLPGYGGNLDLNVFYGTAADWDALGAVRLPVVEQPKPVEPPLVVPPPAPQVVPGVDAPIRDLVRFYGAQT